MILCLEIYTNFSDKSITYKYFSYVTKLCNKLIDIFWGLSCDTGYDPMIIRDQEYLQSYYGDK